MDTKKLACRVNSVWRCKQLATGNMNSKSKFFSASLAAILLAGCATTVLPVGASPEIEVASLDDLPPPRGEIIYTIGAQEALEIFVIGAEELSGTYLTDEQGRLAFPLLGELNMAGVSPSVAARIIADGLRGPYLNDPQVRVIPTEFPEPSISVGGQVAKPGSYPAAGKQTLLRMINQAEGLTEYAKHDDVLVMRTVDDQRYIGVYNITAIQRGNYRDPELYPNDIVMVGDSPARRRLDTILQFVPLVTSTAILIERISR